MNTKLIRHEFGGHPEKTAVFGGYGSELIQNTIYPSPSPEHEIRSHIHFRAFTVIDFLIRRGYDAFITRLDDGFDSICAEGVMNIKKLIHPQIRLFVITDSVERVEKNIRPGKLDLFSKEAEWIITPRANLRNRPMQNSWLAESFSTFICYYDGRPCPNNEFIVDALFYANSVINLCFTENGKKFKRQVPGEIESVLETLEATK